MKAGKSDHLDGVNIYPNGVTGGQKFVYTVQVINDYFTSGQDIQFGIGTFTTNSREIRLVEDTCSGILISYPFPNCTLKFEYDVIYRDWDNILNLVAQYSVLRWSPQHNEPRPMFEWRVSFMGSYDDYGAPPPAAEADPVPPNKQICKLGSIIDVDGQSLREVVPVVGTQFSMYYASTYADAYNSPVNSAIRKSFFNPEGWSISIQNYLDTSVKRIFHGDGTSAAVKALRDWVNNEWSVVSDDGSEVFIFNSEGQQIKTKYSLTGADKYLFTYDSDSKLSYIDDAFGNRTTLTRNSQGLLVSIQAPKGQITNFTTNSRGLLSSISNPNSETFLLTYKSGTDLLATFTKPGGQVSTFTYDGRGRLTKDLGNGGNFVELVSTQGTDSRVLNEYSAGGSNPFYEFWGADGGTFRYSEDSLGQKSEHGQQLDGSSYDWTPTQYTYRSVSDDPRFGSAQKRVNYVYEEKDGVPSTTSFTKNVYGLNPSNIFDFSSIVETAVTNGRTSASAYVSIDKTRAWASHEGVTSEMTIDVKERPVSYQTGSDIPWTLTYNSDGTLYQVTQGSKNTLTSVYNSSGYLQKVTDVLGQETSYTYDLAGRVTHTTLPNGKVTLRSYDSNGNLTGVTPPSRPEHIFQFNAMELVSQYQPPALSGLTVKDTLYSYNLDKQLTNILRPDGQSAAFVYATGYYNYLNEIQISRGSNIFQYQAESNLLSSASSPDGILSSYAYYGRALKSEDQRRASDDYLYAKYVYGFDADHRLTSRTLQGHSTASSSTINTTYNNDDMPTQIGDLNLVYSYPSGRLSATSLGSVSDVRTYSSYGSLASYSSSYVPTSGPTQVLYSYSLTRDNAERITEKTETVLGVTDVYAYTYDNLGRLTSVTKNSAPYSSYAYDDNGNRISGTHATTSFTSTFDDQDRILSYNSRSYAYNANGENSQIQWNTTQQSTYNYDAIGNLIGAVSKEGNILSFKYDGLNRLVQTSVDGVSIHRRIYENDFRIAAQYSDSGTDIKEFIYATNTNSPDYMLFGGIKYRFIKDHLGSPRLIVNTSDGTVAQRLDYTDLGKVIANTNPSLQPFVFAGGIYENYTKLIKFGARYYDPEIGRWTSKDPILFNGGDTNLYGYVMNDPVNFIDPIGLWSFSASLFAGAGGSLTVGADNSSGRPFITMRFGYGLGAGASFDENGSSPVPQCSQNGPNASLGVYAEASVNNGPHEFGYTSGFGVSSRRGIPYYRIANPVNTLGTSSGVGGGASAGFELSFF